MVLVQRKQNFPNGSGNGDETELLSTDSIDLRVIYPNSSLFRLLSEIKQVLEQGNT